MHITNSLCALLSLMHFLSGSMHKVGPIYIGHAIMYGEEKHLPCALFPVSPEQVTYMVCIKPETIIPNYCLSIKLMNFKVHIFQEVWILTE